MREMPVVYQRALPAVVALCTMSAWLAGQTTRPGLAPEGPDRLLAPSYVTLHLKDAKADDIFAELSKQCGATISRISERTFIDDDTVKAASRRISVDIDHKPFWEVMPDLCQQLEIDFRTMRPNVGFAARLPLREELADIEGPFLIVADRITYSDTRAFAAERPEPPRIAVLLNIYPEPKIKVLCRAGKVKLDEATDDHGNSLVPQEGDLPKDSKPQESWFEPQLVLSVPLRSPRQDPGARIAKLTGSTQFVIQTRSEKQQVPVTKFEPTTKLVLGTSLTFKAFTKEGTDGFLLGIKVVLPKSDEMDDRGLLQTVLRDHLQLLDADGQAFTYGGFRSFSENKDSIETSIAFYRGYHYRKGENGRTVRGAALQRDPVQFVLDLPTQTTLVAVPIKLKDILLFDKE